MTKSTYHHLRLRGYVRFVFDEYDWLSVLCLLKIK
jgi:hypothetical protein